MLPLSARASSRATASGANCTMPGSPDLVVFHLQGESPALARAHKVSTKRQLRPRGAAGRATSPLPKKKTPESQKGGAAHGQHPNSFKPAAGFE
jgi:hypothetical protein